MTTYHLEFNGPVDQPADDEHRRRFASVRDAVAAHDELAGIPDGATRVVDDIGLVHAVLYMPPVELCEAEFGNGMVEALVSEVTRIEAAGGWFDVAAFTEFTTAFNSIQNTLRLVHERAWTLRDRMLRARRSTRLLVVEDEPTTLRAIVRMATVIGFTHIVTSRTLNSLRLMLSTCAQDAFPQVMLSDYDLPDGTGCDAQALVLAAAEQGRHQAPLLIAHSANPADMDLMFGTKVLKTHIEDLDRALRDAHARVC